MINQFEAIIYTLIGIIFWDLAEMVFFKYFYFKYFKSNKSAEVDNLGNDE